MPLIRRVEIAFPPTGDDAFGEAFMHAAIERWRDVQASLRRVTTLQVVLVTGFLLLASAKHDAAFDLGPLKLTSTAPLLVWGPVLISFVGLEALTLQLGYWRYQAAVGELMARLHPRVSEVGLHHLLAPPTVSLWGMPPWERLRTVDPDGLTRARRWVSGALAVVIVLAWMGLVFGAYLWLRGHHPDPVAYWISLALTTLNVVRGGMLFVDEENAGALD
jgi:hypothetical protein